MGLAVPVPPAATSATSATSQPRAVADQIADPLPPLPGSGGSGSGKPSATTLTRQVAEVAEVAHTPPADDDGYGLGDFIPVPVKSATSATSAASAGQAVADRKPVADAPETWDGAVALAGLGNLPDTLMIRADERIEPYRRRVHLAAGHAIRDELAAWATSATAAGIGDAWPEMPAGIADRNADVWECLLIIADAAGGNWPQRARVAAVALVADSQADGSASLGIRLLGDIRSAWDRSDGMHSDKIVGLLNELDEAPWGDLKGKPLDQRPDFARAAALEASSFFRLALRWPAGMPASPASASSCGRCGQARASSRAVSG